MTAAGFCAPYVPQSDRWGTARSRSANFSGDPGWIRTSDLQLRRLLRAIETIGEFGLTLHPRCIHACQSNGAMKPGQGGAAKPQRPPEIRRRGY